MSKALRVAAAELDLAKLRRSKKPVRPHRIRPLPRGTFGCIVADPPWPYGNQATRAATGRHYEVLSLDEICALPVGEKRRPSTHLYLWTPVGFLPEAFRVLAAWGFVLKHLMHWVKTQDVQTCVSRVDGVLKVHHMLTEAVDLEMSDARHPLYSLESDRVKLQVGLGNYGRHTEELCLFATAQGGPAVRVQANVPTTFFAAREEHSRKPDVLQRLAELLSPGPRLELFARRRLTGWTGWGNEL